MSEFLIISFEKKIEKTDRGGGLLPPLSPGGVNEYINKKERLNATKTRSLAL